jgi:hypothetical protein
VRVMNNQGQGAETAQAVEHDESLHLEDPFSDESGVRAREQAPAGVQGRANIERVRQAGKLPPSTLRPMSGQGT